MITPVWLKAAWEWLKKYWKWLLFPIGILAYLVGRASAKTNVTVVSPGLIEHAEVEARLDAEAAEKKQEADVAAAAQLNQVELTRRREVDAESNKQVAAAEAAQDDPQKVNDLLKQVGKDMRK